MIRWWRRIGFTMQMFVLITAWALCVSLVIGDLRHRIGVVERQQRRDLIVGTSTPPVTFRQ